MINGVFHEQLLLVCRVRTKPVEKQHWSLKHPMGIVTHIPMSPGLLLLC